jgi:hypothetical protein
MALPPPRIVTLVLVGADCEVLGALPPFEAATPWWQDIAPVCRAVHERHGLSVTVLRLLGAERGSPPGGAVTYLAQADAAAASAVPLQPWQGELPDDPRRQTYARIGGPAADLQWARDVLKARGDAPTGAAEQIRTWNLSSLWRLPARSGAVWLKVVPSFFAHEGAVLAARADAPVPRLLGREGSRLLLAELPGSDRYDAALPERLQMIELLVSLQTAWQGRVDDLLALGLPDWRGPALTVAIADVVARCAKALSNAERRTLEAFVDGLPARFSAVAACGLADGLMHGDFHPGNLRGDAGSLALLDWGDSGIGHPLLDQTAFLRTAPVDEAQSTLAHWQVAWQSAVPGADPARARQLLAPVATARAAVVYQRFLDHIERAEHPYHQADVPDYLARTAAIIASSSAVSAGCAAR